MMLNLICFLIQWMSEKIYYVFINFFIVDNYKSRWFAILLKYVIWWMCKYWWLLICEMENVVELKWFYVMYVI